MSFCGSVWSSNNSAVKELVKIKIVVYRSQCHCGADNICICTPYLEIYCIVVTYIATPFVEILYYAS